MKHIVSSKLGFFSIAVILLWIKTYCIYVIEFNLDVQGGLQHFLLFINPLSSTLFFLAIALFAKGRRAGIWMIIVDFIMSFLVYANVVYYRANSDYITLPTLFQTSNFGSLGGSIASSVAWYDVLYFLDLFILIGVFIWSSSNWAFKRSRIKQPLAIMMIAVIVFIVNLGMAETDRPELLKRAFDRNYIVKYLGSYNFAIYDAVQSLQSSSQRIFADSNDMTEVENYTNNKYAEPDSDLFGAAKGKNVIKIHLESVQSFLIDYKLHGEEVTPFLNSLVHDEDENFTYFDNFFHQTEQGKTADAELTMDNSIYGLPQGAAFTTKGKNTYQALPEILDQEEGYTSAVLHGDDKSFWNRDEIYKQFGVDKFFDSSYYDMDDENVINYGLKDKPFFQESMPLLESLDEPFYSHLITLTNHHPYLIEDDDATIESADTGDPSVDRYFQTARYLDESLEEFFDYLKEAGLYDDSVIILYGDHYGISDNHKQAMSEIMDKEITPFEDAQLQRVPFMIKAPGVEGQGVNHKYSSEIDVMPTLLHLMGIDTQDYIQFGTDLFSKDHQEFVPFRNGDYVTPDYTKVGSSYYDTDSGDKIRDVDDNMKEMTDTVNHELALSDKLLFGDLLRFYQPTDDWEPVDPSNYQYDKDTQDDKKQEEDHKDQDHRSDKSDN